MEKDVGIGAQGVNRGILPSLETLAVEEIMSLEGDKPVIKGPYPMISHLS